MTLPYVRIPADTNNGKRITHSQLSYISYSNGTTLFIPNTLVSGSVSGAQGFITTVTGTAVSGTIEVQLSPDSPGVFTSGENLIVNGTVYAQVATTPTDFYTPCVEVVSGTNPRTGLTVNPDGTLPVKLIGLDAFQRLKVSETTYLGEHTFNFNSSSLEFTDVLTNGSTITFDTLSSGAVLTTPTTSGATAQRTTNLYHRYVPGTAHVVEMTVALGDTGKANVVRRWGYYDDKDGVFFEHDGTTVNAVLRHSVTGTVVEERTPINLWNTDVLDGSNSFNNVSGMRLDVSKDVIYWMDVQWLGAGTVRYGVFHDGEQITCHAAHHDNRRSVSYMRTGSLPLRIEQFNTNTAASISQMRAFCLVAKTEGGFHPRRYQFGYDWSTFTSIGNLADVPLFSLRAKRTNSMGIDNRDWILPSTISIYTTQPIAFNVLKNSTLTGDTWGITSSDPASTAEFNSTGSISVVGRNIHGEFVEPNFVGKIDISFAECQCSRMTRNADPTLYSLLTFTARSLTSTPADVTVIINWEEIRC